LVREREIFLTDEPLSKLEAKLSLSLRAEALEGLACYFTVYF
jgi:ABC-type sugar transport system ATPase subunit